MLIYVNFETFWLSPPWVEIFSVNIVTSVYALFILEQLYRYIVKLLWGMTFDRANPNPTNPEFWYPSPI